MRNRISAMIVGGALLAAAPASAEVYCYQSGALEACASATLSYDGGTQKLTVSIQNLSGAQGNTYFLLTGFGLYYLEPNVGGGTLSLDAFTGWSNGVPADLLAPGPDGTETWIGGAFATSGTNYAIGGCTPPVLGPASVINTCGGPVDFVFTVTNGGALDLENLYFAYRGQAWSDAQGNEVGAGSFKCYSSDEDCIPDTEIPEPATMVLLATGLVGLSGAGYIRRRRQQKQS